MVLHAPKPRRILKPDTAPPPLSIFGGHVLRDEYDPGRPSDKVVLAGFGLGGDEREQSAAIGRSDRQPPVTRMKHGIEGQIESQLIQVEMKTRLLIANINVDRVNTEVGAVRAGIVSRR
jgi:hypothetical protein